MKVPLMVSWTALALIATAFSQDKTVLLDQLRAAADAELLARESKAASKESISDQNFKRAVSQLKLLPPEALEAELGQAIGAVHSTASDPATRKAAEALNALLQKEAADRKEKTKATIEAAAKRAAEIGLKATTAKELDAPIAELAELTGNAARYSFEDYSSAASIAGAQRVQPLLNWLQQRQEFLLQKEAGDRKAARQVLQRFSGTSVNLAPWIPRSELLAQQAADLKEMSPSSESLQAQLEKVSEISRKILAAGDPKEIDPLVTQIADFQRGSADDYTEGRQRVQEAAQNVRDFARQWQEFLVARQVGDLKRARDILFNMTSGTRDYPGVPRSELLAKAYGEKVEAAAGEKPPAGTSLKSVEQIMKEMTSLEAANRLLPELESAVRTSRDSEYQIWMMSLQEVLRSYRDFKAGNATRVSLNVTGMAGGDDLTLNLRNELAMLVLPVVIGAGDQDQPRAGENPLTYLRRMLNTAKERKDWLLAQRVLTTAQNTGMKDPLMRTVDTTAITQFLSGMTLEKGKQFALAVNAFQLALKAGSDLIPPEEIGERLEAIKKAHPEAYKEGTELTMNPPVPRNPEAYRGSGGPYSSGYPRGRDYPPGVQRGEQQVLVPARPQQAPTAESTAGMQAEKPAEKPAEAKPAPAP